MARKMMVVDDLAIEIVESQLLPALTEMSFSLDEKLDGNFLIKDRESWGTAADYLRKTCHSGVAFVDVCLNTQFIVDKDALSTKREKLLFDQISKTGLSFNSQKHQGYLLAVVLAANVNADVDIVFATRGNLIGEEQLTCFRRFMTTRNCTRSISISQTPSTSGGYEEDNLVLSSVKKGIEDFFRFREVPSAFCSRWWPEIMDTEFQQGQDVPHSFPGKWSTVDHLNDDCEIRKIEGVIERLGGHISSIGISERHCRMLASQENFVGRSIWECLKMIFGTKAGCQHPNGDGEDVPMGVVLLSGLAAIQEGQIERISFDNDSAGLEKKTNTPRDSYRKCVKAFYELFSILSQEEHTLNGEGKHLPKFSFDVFGNEVRVSIDIDGSQSNKPQGIPLLDCLKAVKNGEVSPCGELTKQIGIVLKLCRDVDIDGTIVRKDGITWTELSFSINFEKGE